MTKTTEHSLLKSWQLKIAILTSILIPVGTVFGAFYNLKTSIVEVKSEANERVSRLELDAQRNFVDKDTVKQVQQEVQEMHQDIIKIKVLLERKL